jgi:DNA repair exonuclease SbcCD ATPase subunit
VAFEDSSARALDVVNGLLSAAELGRGQMLDLRDRILAATERLDADWALLRERARAFLEQATGQEQQLTALRVDAGRAADALREHLDELEQQGQEEAQATQGEIEAAAAEVEQTGQQVVSALHEAEQTEQALASSLQEIEHDLAQALGEADELLRGSMVAEVRGVEHEVEKGAIALSAYVSGQVVPQLEQRAYDLYLFLAQAEADVRATLEASLEAHESAADAVLRETAGGYDDTLKDLGRLATSLEDLIEDLRDFIEDGREALDDRKRRWDEAVRRSREGLRDAQESLKEVEQFLARFSFSAR